MFGIEPILSDWIFALHPVVKFRHLLVACIVKQSGTGKQESI